MASAKVTHQRVGDTFQVSVSGYIGEHSDLFDLVLSGCKEAVVDLVGVNYINSVGVKNWIDWTRRFPQGVPVYFENCPALIVNQVNMVSGFLPADAVIESLLAPFVCEDCNAENQVLMRRGVDFQYATAQAPQSLTVPKVMCERCKKPMVLDALESKFFAFLKYPLPKAFGP